MRFLIQIVLLLTACLPASAHFSQDVRTRTILVAHDEGMTVAFVQMPAPLVFADLVETSQRTGDSIESPFLFAVQSGNALLYHVSSSAIAKDSDTFARRIADSLIWHHAGRRLEPHVRSIRIAGPDEHGDFATLDEATTELARPGAKTDSAFGDTLIEVEILLDPEYLTGTIDVRSGFPAIYLDPGLTIENVLIDARVSPPVSRLQTGQLEKNAAVDGSRIHAFRTFLWQGVLHIVEGPDHVLLVVSIALAAGLSWNLLWLVTAFTLGHSVTLVAAFLGLTPQWSWFIPAVETAIAVSVLYAAVVALARRTGSPWVFGLIGLLHGLGFSFVLSDILGLSSPHLVLSLFAFNIGIELGQVAILALVLTIVALLSQMSLRAVQPIRIAVLVMIAMISGWWIAERFTGIV